MTPSPLAVYAVEGANYFMTRVVPPARSYHLDVPPGNYQVVARLDADPLSSAGYLRCDSSSCLPVMTRAGYVTCRSADCQPYLVTVRVEASQSETQIDVGGWGSLHALNALWGLDEFGVPGPAAWQVVSPGVRPTPAPQLPYRSLPSPSSEVLPAAYGVPDIFDAQVVDARLHLPGGWRQVPNPAREVESNIYVDYANEPGRTPFALDQDGVWLTVSATDFCNAQPTTDGTARAIVSGPVGVATVFFEDPHSPMGRQPFSGYAFWGIKPLVAGTCLTFRFTTLSEESREANLPTFIAIVQHAELVTAQR